MIWRQNHIRAEAHEIAAPAFATLAERVEAANSDLPGILPAFDPVRLRGRWNPVFGRYDAGLVGTWLETAIAALENARERAGAEAAVEPMDFSFIADPRLRAVLERDGFELQRALAENHWKSGLILSGGIIEGILLDLLRKHPEALTAATAPKKNDLSRWTLDDLIRVALELNAVNGALGRLSHTVREYRNLVHPGRELRENLSFGREEAAIAVEVLRILLRELRAAPGDS